MKKYEGLFHAIPIAIALAMSIVGLPLTLYNNSGFNCWYAPYPAGCRETGNCTRGSAAGTFRWIHYGLIWSAIVIVFISMCLIFRAVYTQESKASYLRDSVSPSTSTNRTYRRGSMGSADSACNNGQLSGEGGPNEVVHTRRQSRSSLSRKKSRRSSQITRKTRTKTKLVAMQAFYYIASLLLAWFFTTVRKSLNRNVVHASKANNSRTSSLSWSAFSKRSSTTLVFHFLC